MKISPSVLRTIALSAGIAAGISAASADEKSAPANAKVPVPPANGRVAKPEVNAGVTPEARAMFIRHDTDKDGKLSMEEFNKAFAELLGEPQLAPPQIPGPIDPCPGCGMG